MPGRSTVTQLLGFVHKIGSALDNGQQSDVIYLDFAIHGKQFVLNVVQQITSAIYPSVVINNRNISSSVYWYIFLIV